MTKKTTKSRVGGARPGSGRKPGTKNAATIAKEALLEEVIAKAVEGETTPLEVMLQIMRDPASPAAMRFEAAKAAAPYVHPRLSQVDSTVTHKNAADEFNEAELLAIARAGSSRAARPANGKAEPDSLH